MSLSLEGRHCNWGLRVHKLVSEALERMRWSAFRKWNEHHTNPVDLDELTVSLEICVQKWVGTPSTQCWNQRRSIMQRRDRPTFSSAYHVVQRSVVVIIWWACSYSLQDQHVGQTISFTSNVFWSCCHGSVPHSNNARYLPVYTLHMLQLPTKHPEPH